MLNWETLKKEVAINDCHGALATHADLFLKYAQMYAAASAKKEEMKWQSEKVYAIIREALRRDADTKVTEARLDMLATAHPEYVNSKEDYLKASEEESALKLAIQALSIRRDMLINLSASMREEAYQGIQSGTHVPQPADALTALKESFSKKYGN